MLPYQRQWQDDSLLVLRLNGLGYWAMDTICIREAEECDVCGEEIDSKALHIPMACGYAPTRICEDCLGKLYEDVYAANHGHEGLVKCEATNS